MKVNTVSITRVSNLIMFAAALCLFTVTDAAAAGSNGGGWIGRLIVDLNGSHYNGARGYTYSHGRGNGRNHGYGKPHHHGGRHADSHGRGNGRNHGHEKPHHHDGRHADDSTKPLILEDQGSFFVGGEKKQSDAISGISGGGFGPNEGTLTIHQMYVQYMTPVDSHKVPVVMVHGCCLSSKSWEETPDGRMGWDEYFVRKGHPTYLADQVSRARSGFDQTIINEVKLGIRPPSDLPSIFSVSNEVAWTAFRFGPTFGTPYDDEQFPVEAFDEFTKQIIPDLNALLDPMNNPTWTNMAALAAQLDGAVLMGHSESSSFPTRAALIDPTGVKGIVQLETGCIDDLSPDQINTLAAIPILIMVGDHMSQAQPPASCVTMMGQITGAGGDMTFISLPDIGIYGNSHMMMLDKNNLDVADVILKWIDEHVNAT